MPERRLRAVRWRRASYVPQSAQNSLVPDRTLRWQFRDTAAPHGMRRRDAEAVAAVLLQRVELDPAALDRYPHELSGGMRQRAIIALALLFDPVLLVADEPTTGLDVIVQRQTVTLLPDLRAECQLALLFISYDIGVVAELCDRVAVLHAGRVMEPGRAVHVLSEPCHPYTIGLKRSFPDIREPTRPIASIAGHPPRLSEPMTGCAFAHRCPFAQPICKHFRTGRQLLGKGTLVPTVDDVSFTLLPGRVLGIVGESGSGKSTLANLLVGLETLTSGEIMIDGRDLPRRRDTSLRRNVQMVFQDPFGSINPRFTIGRTVEAPLVIRRMGNATGRRQRTIEALEDAELRPGAAFLDRHPDELSGGQRQRVAIARAIVLRPRLLVADEPVSMLDVWVRAGILRLLRRLVTEGGMAMVFITHDLSIAGSICDHLAVMYRGRFVEYGPVLDVLRQPIHPYTSALIAAVPLPDPTIRAQPLPARLLAGAGVAVIGPGCRFYPRCELAVRQCEAESPGLADVYPGHRVACHRVGVPA